MNSEQLSMNNYQFQNSESKQVHPSSLILHPLLFATLFFFFFSITVQPSNAQSVAQSVDRKTPPALGETPVLKLPPIQKFSLKNGLQIIVLEKNGVPLVQMNLLVRTGVAIDSSEKVALAKMTATMLDEGVAGKSSLEFADAVDFLGASISTNAGAQFSTISLRTPTSKLNDALKLFADVTLHPDFPQNELDRLRKEQLTSLMQAHDQPRTIADAAHNQFLFSTKHPYGENYPKLEATLNALTVDGLKIFYESCYRPNNAVLVIVGAVKAKEMAAQAEKLFGAWKKGNVPSVHFTDAAQVKGRTIFLIDKPDAAQSEIRIGRIGAARLTEDYFPLVVMNTILGGSFTSRLNQNLRETHGYSYGAGSGFDFRMKPGGFVASSAVQTDVTDKALQEFINELTNICTPVSDAELTRAKNYLALGYPGDFQSVAQIAMQLGEIVLYGLPDEYINNYIPKVLAVTKNDVERVAKKYIDVNAINIVVVGDKKKVEEGIQKLKLGDVKNLSIDDVLGAAPK